MIECIEILCSRTRLEKGSGRTWETFKSKCWKGWHVERSLHVFLWWQWCGHVGSRRCNLQWGWGHCHWVRSHSLLSLRTVWFHCLFMAVPALQSMLLLTEDQSHDRGMRPTKLIIILKLNLKIRSINQCLKKKKKKKKKKKHF
jgi:hypothetical protein